MKEPSTTPWLDGPDSGAVFSPCERYRYVLWRRWPSLFGCTTTSGWCTHHQRDHRWLVFVMLNPSTATATEDDPTIRRVIDFAKRWGYVGVIIVNLFAFRATDPEVMEAEADPVGPDNDHWIARVTSMADRVICAWGARKTASARAGALVERVLPRPLYCLRRTKKTGAPEHPLYMPASIEPSVWAA